MRNQVCLYILGCRVPQREICTGNFEKCTIYQRTRVLDRHKTRTGLQRFMDRYKNWEQLGIGSRI